MVKSISKDYFKSLINYIIIQSVKQNIQITSYACYDIIFQLFNLGHIKEIEVYNDIETYYPQEALGELWNINYPFVLNDYYVFHKYFDKTLLNPFTMEAVQILIKTYKNNIFTIEKYLTKYPLQDYNKSKTIELWSSPKSVMKMPFTPEFMI